MSSVLHEVHYRVFVPSSGRFESLEGRHERSTRGIVEIDNKTYKLLFSLFELTLESVESSSLMALWYSPVHKLAKKQQRLA